MPDLQMAAVAIEPVDVLGLRSSGVLLRRMRNRMEYIRNRRNMPDLLPSVEMDVMPLVLGLVASQ